MPDRPPPPHLPPEFIRRMEQILGAEAADFFAAYAQSPDAGLRFNPLKGTADQLRAGLPFELAPLPWSGDGFRIIGPVERASSNSQTAGGQSTRPYSPGLHPYHAAGLYYIQEPSAQAVAEILDPQPGERVLDLAAAPGGKSTHIAGKMQGQGLLLANEIHPKRVWDLAKNLERWGARNVMVANETPERLAARLPEYFDRMLVDAPCSGEGMFRKMPEAVRDWSPDFVAGCSLRQSSILEDAARLLRPGGRMVYATCTFAPEEDEGVIGRFLKSHSDFRLITPEWRPGFRAGLPPLDDRAAGSPVRLWPHLAPGEGHFIALLEKAGGAPRPPSENVGPASISDKNRPKPANDRPSPALARLLPYWESFCRESLSPEFAQGIGDLQLVKSYLYAAPGQAGEMAGLNLVRPGWWLGSFKKDRFEPSHALAMGLKPEDARRTACLEGRKVEAFLHREAFPHEGEDGWTLVLLEDRYPLGWGKRVRGLLKNHYPAGLRKQNS